LSRELANKDMYRPSRGVPEPRLVSRSEGMVRTIYPRGRCEFEFVPRGEPPHRGGRRVGFGRGELGGRSLSRGQYEYGGTITALSPSGATDHDLPLVVSVVLQGDVWVFHLDRMDFANPTFEKMARH
jgi:hypothetical protein